MKEATCISEAVYSHALTRGKRYDLHEIDRRKQQVRIEGDHKRFLWIPMYCFDFDNQPVVQMMLYCIDDPDKIQDQHIAMTEVTIKMSTGELRWCIFATPGHLAQHGDWIPETKVRFHFSMRHTIIINEITYVLIEKVLRYIDSQGELIECTLPLAN